MLKKQFKNGHASCEVTFVLPKDHVQTENNAAIKVLGEFNDWSWDKGLILNSIENEYVASIELEPGKSYQFRYLVEGGTWLNDPAADAYVSSPFPGIDNSVVTVESMNGNGHVAAAEAPAAKPKAKAKAKAKPKAKAKTTKKKTGKDNIKKHIEGIGPKIEKLLAAREITTFNQLAKADIKILKEILEEAGPRFKMHDPTTWSEQAKLAAAEKWEELETLKDELKGGRRV
ncbi:MAG: glycoside hydrolase family 13 [Bacteroidota bacterium]